MMPMPSLMYTTPMCGPTPTKPEGVNWDPGGTCHWMTSRPNKECTWLSTSMAPTLPPMSTTPVGGGEFAEDALQVSQDSAENKRAARIISTSVHMESTCGDSPITWGPLLPSAQQQRGHTSPLHGKLSTPSNLYFIYLTCLHYCT